MEAAVIESGEFKYLDEGTGEPMVILHGLFGALSNFQNVRKHFSKRFRVLTPMLPIYELPLRKTSAKEILSFLCRVMVNSFDVSCFSFLASNFGSP